MYHAMVLRYHAMPVLYHAMAFICHAIPIRYHAIAHCIVLCVSASSYCCFVLPRLHHATVLLVLACTAKLNTRKCNLRTPCPRNAFLGRFDLSVYAYAVDCVPHSRFRGVLTPDVVGIRGWKCAVCSYCRRVCLELSGDARYLPTRVLCDARHTHASYGAMRLLCDVRC